MGLNVTTLPVVAKDLSSLLSPRFTPNEFLSRCKFSSLTTRQNTLALTLSATEEVTKIMIWTRIELTTSALAGVQVTY